MPILRRRTGAALHSVLFLLLAGSLAGAVMVIWRDPLAAACVVLAALLVAAASARMFGEVELFAPVGGVLAMLGLGAYALYLAGFVRAEVAFVIAVGELALVFVLLVRALISAGAASDPYED